MSKAKKLSLLLAFSIVLQAGVGSVGGMVPLAVSGDEVKEDERFKLVAGAEDKVEVLRGESAQLEVSKDLAEDIKWRSINEPIATVDQTGLVTGHEKGMSIVIAEDANGNSQAWEIAVNYIKDVPEVDAQVYAKLREKWLGTVIGANNNLDSPNVARIIERVDGFVARHWESIITDGGVLWDANNTINYKTDPAHTRTMYLNLEWMAKGYSTPESQYYKNEDLLKDIKYALEWLYENGYNKQVQYGNWWQWEIGIPKALNNIGVMLYDELGQELIGKYTDVILFHQPDPFNSGSSGVSNNKFRESVAANRVDVSLVSLVTGILRNDYEQLLMTRDAISTLLKYEETEDGKLNDGFYPDGSFIQHGHVPYVGTYGQVFLTGLSTVTKALENSVWEVPKDKLDILTSFAMDSYVPFIYQGAAMDMVRGRAISRENASDKDSGRGIIGAFTLLAETMPEDLAKELKSYIKYWILEDESNAFLTSTNNIELINLAEAILGDEALKAPKMGVSHKNFPLMDRAVHTGDGFAVGLSMFSSRISNFEYMNGENIRGWHTADGMLYLYNNDLDHYSDNYWNTVNPYRLPGTTVDTIKLDKEALANNGDNGQKLFSQEDWVGGTSLGVYGINGMALNGDLVTDKGEEASSAPYKTLRAKKSYFMFDDEIVMLGSDINSTDNREIETIIENRKIKDDASNKVTISSETVLGQEQSEAVNAQWVHLEGNKAGADIAYYFPSNETIQIQKVENKGSWADVRVNSSKDEVKKNYLEIYLSHGKNPVNKTYEYVLMPGKTPEQTRAYAKNPEIEILANNPAVQAVKEKSLGLVGANFWADQETTIDKLKVNKKASVMYQEKDGLLEIAVSDPTMKNDGTIELEFDAKGAQVISKDQAIDVTALGAKIKLSVNVKDAQGKTFNIKIKLDK